MGHILVGLDLGDGAPPPADHFPQPGSLEALASGTALDGLAREAAQRNPEGALGRAVAAAGKVTGVDVVRAAKDGDEEAVDLVRILGERLGVGIASAINLFDPEEVVIGGGVATRRRPAARAGALRRGRLRADGGGRADRDPARAPWRGGGGVRRGAARRTRGSDYGGE